MMCDELFFMLQFNYCTHAKVSSQASLMDNPAETWNMERILGTLQNFSCHWFISLWYEYFAVLYSTRAFILP